MGIGCRRDPLEANVWYVKAAEQGDARATHRIAAIRAAAEGTTPEAAGARTKKKFNGTSARHDTRRHDKLTTPRIQMARRPKASGSAYSSTEASRQRKSYYCIG